MDKQNQNINNNIIEINLKDFIWNLIAQWKAVLLFSILIATLVLFLGYKADQKEYTRAVKEQEQKERQPLNLSDQKKFTDEYGGVAVQILDALDETDRDEVVKLLRQEKTLKAQQEYMSDSAYMNLDPEHARCLSMGYSIICENAKDEKYLNILVNEYGNLIMNNKLLKGIKGEMKLDIDDSYIRELISIDTDVTISSADKAGIDSFYINVWIPEEVTEISGIGNVISETIRDISVDLSKNIVVHNIKLIQTRDYITADSSLLIAQTDMVNRITTMSNNVNISKNALQGEQKKAYELITEENSDSEKNTVQPIWQKLEGVSTPHISIKYFLMGIIFGVILYILICIMRIIIKNIGYTPELLKNMTGSRILGVIRLPVKTGGVRMLFGSPFVEKIRYRSRGTLETQINKTVSEITTVCRYKKISELTLIECGSFDEVLKTNLTLIRDSLSTLGIVSTCTDFEELKAEDFLNIKNCIITIQKDITKMNEIKKMLEQLTEFKINIIGIIYYE